MCYYSLWLRQQRDVTQGDVSTSISKLYVTKFFKSRNSKLKVKNRSLDLLLLHTVKKSKTSRNSTTEIIKT